jgi:hypothetical protein
MKSKIMINLSSWEEERGKLRSEGKCEGMNSHTPKGTSTLGVGVLLDSQIF